MRTRTALRNAMLKLLARLALEKITILDICQAGGIGYTTFFRHYASKESLLDDVAAGEIAHLIGLTVPIAVAEDLQAAGVALFNYIDEHRVLWSTLLTGGAKIVMRNEFLRLSRQVASTRAHVNDWPPAEISTILVVSSTVELVSWWLQQKKPLPIAEIAAIYERIIIQPHVQGDRIPPERRTRMGRRKAGGLP